MCVLSIKVLLLQKNLETFLMILVIIICDTNRPFNFIQKTKPGDRQPKKKTSQIIDFCHPVKQQVIKKRDRYLNFDRELKNLWNMKVTIIPIVIGVRGTVIKGLV